jgi:DeoR/GlpR family transcriptional regulator of sugar metabolism
MRFNDKKEKLDYLSNLLIKKKTGNTKVLSNKLCVSPRTIRRRLDELREQGYQISFCTQRSSYLYMLPLKDLLVL